MKNCRRNPIGLPHSLPQMHEKCNNLAATPIINENKSENKSTQN